MFLGVYLLIPQTGYTIPAAVSSSNQEYAMRKAFVRNLLRAGMAAGVKGW